MRSNAEWFGDLDKKAAIGRLKIAISTDGFNSEMHRFCTAGDVAGPSRARDDPAAGLIPKT